MRLYIEKKNLEHLLENKSEYIENNITWDTIFAAVSFLLSALTANYDSFFMIPSIIIKYFFIVIGVLYLFKIGKEFMTKKYNMKI